MGFFSKISEGLKKTRNSVMGSVNAMLRSFTRIDEELFEELEEILIMSDAGASTASHICDELRRKVKERGETRRFGNCSQRRWRRCCAAGRS